MGKWLSDDRSDDLPIENGVSGSTVLAVTMVYRYAAIECGSFEPIARATTKYSRLTVSQ